METSRKEFLLAPSPLFIIILLTSLASLRAYANNGAGDPPATVACVTPTIFNVGHSSQTDEYGGVNVTLSGSQPGVRYNLIFTPLPVEDNTGSVVRTMNGATSSLVFEPVYEEGVYTIVGTRVSGGCSATMNGSYTLAIVPEQFEVFGGGTHCEGGSGVTINLSGSQPRVKYQLKVNGNPVGDTLNGNTSMLAWNNVRGGGNYTVTAFSQTNTTNMAGSASVTEMPAPQKFTIGGDGSYVMGQADIPVTLSGSQPGVSYQLMAEGYNYKVGKPITGTGEALTWNIDAFSARLFIVATNTTNGCVADMEGRVYISTSSVQADASHLDALAFRYTYDDQRRMTAKKIPGAAWQYIVYDDRNRVVLTQDGEQRKINQWTFTKYDALNRPVMTGLYVHPEAATPETMQGLIAGGTAFETYNGDAVAHGYTNTAFPTTGHTVLTATYYDSYAFKDMLTGTVVHTASGNSEADYNYRNNEIGGQETTPLASIKGYTTATKVNILGTGDYLWSVNYYDTKKRIIQSIADNAKGGTDRVTNVYDFTGKVTSTRTTHQVEGGSPRSVSKRFTYDHAGRLITTSHEFTESVSWANVTGATVSNDYLTNSSVSGVNSGAESARQFADGQNVWVETLVDQTNRDKFIGFHPAESGGTPCEIKYRFGLRHNGQLQVFENGVSIGVVGTFAVGDRVGLERIGEVVYYKKNGEVLHTSQIPSTGKIKIKACFQNDAARFYKTTIGYGEVLLLENEYNELGELVTKKLHSENNGSSFMQHVDYRYNIRGWLARINNADLNNNPDGGPRDYFGMEFGYDNDLGVGEYDPQYNGNISATKWSANLGLASPFVDEPTERAYAFRYDPLNRMESALHFKKAGLWEPVVSFGEEAEYDLNGNILSLNRYNKYGRTLDALSYDYAGNKLLSVTDEGIPDASFKDGNTDGDDFTYDSNGNLVTDLNKGMDIGYDRYLNFTASATMSDGRSTKYIYNAEGIKLGEENYKPGSETPDSKVAFIGPFVYENDTLKYIQHNEGRIVVPGPASEPLEYQYQMKDHLGNVRLTFTTKQEADTLKATMEDTGEASYANPRVQEMAVFNNLFETEIRNVSQWLNHTSNSNGYAVYLDGSDERTIGPYTMLKVYPGDTVSIDVYGKFEKSGSHSAKSVAAMLAALATPIQTAAAKFEVGTGIITPSFNEALALFLGNKSVDDDIPAAYVNYILFDEHLSPVDLGFDRMEEPAGFDPGTENTVDFDRMTLNRVIDFTGYIYVYTSNETPGTKAYFDDLIIAIKRSPVVQFEDYYPFGLSMSGTAFSRDNDKYTGMVSTEGAGLKDIGFRQYDPALGRFHAVDPLAELQSDNSTYHYANNNPVNKTDVLGLEADESDLRPELGRRKPKKPRVEVQGRSVRVHQKFFAKRDRSNRNNAHASGNSNRKNNNNSQTSTGKKKGKGGDTASASGSSGNASGAGGGGSGSEPRQQQDVVNMLVSGPPLNGVREKLVRRSDPTRIPDNETAGNLQPRSDNSLHPGRRDDDYRSGYLPLEDADREAREATDRDQLRQSLAGKLPIDEALALYERYGSESSGKKQNVEVANNTLPHTSTRPDNDPTEEDLPLEEQEWWRDIWKRAAEALTEHLKKQGFDVGKVHYDEDGNHWARTVIVLERKGQNSRTDGTIESFIEIEFNDEQTALEIVEILDAWGIEDPQEQVRIVEEDAGEWFKNYAGLLDSRAQRGEGLGPGVVQAFADMLMAPYQTVNGWRTDRHWRTGQDLKWWEHVLGVMDIIPAEAIARLGITTAVIKIGGKVLNIAKIRKRTRDLMLTAKSSGLRIAVNKSDEVLITGKNGNAVARVRDGAFEVVDSRILSKFQNDQAGLAKLTEDIAGQPALLKAFDDSPGMVDAWKKMNQLGADDALRRNPGALDALSKPKGSRPDPSTYLDQSYIDSRLTKFNNEGQASRVVSKDSYLRNGVGKPDVGKTEFVALKSDIDDILKLPIEEQAAKLGVPIEQLQNGGLVRIDFNLNSSNKVEMPSGNEWGANDLWIPGGKTSGGASEAIIKTEGMQLNIDYTVKDL